MFKHKLKTIDRKCLDIQIAKFFGCGIAENNVIVSLTSFPERINEIHYTIYSLLNQSYKPSGVILWLAYEQFPNKEKDLPENLLKLQNNGLTIKWCNNIYSYKKLIPTLKEYPDKTIVTADDDVYYEKDWLKILVENSKIYPNTIIAHRAHRVKVTTKIKPYKHWKKKIKSCAPSYKNFLTGIGGVLYPPHSLDSDVLNEDLFNKLAPKADDVWFWAMAVLNHTKIFVPKNNIKDSIYINPERERGIIPGTTLFSMNKNGGNDLQINNVIDYYPQIINILHENSSDNIIKTFVLFLISIYRKLSKYTPAVCRFQPTCSEYTRQAIVKYGVIKGTWLGIKRISRCHPDNEGGYDPVP